MQIFPNWCVSPKDKNFMAQWKCVFFSSGRTVACVTGTGHFVQELGNEETLHSEMLCSGTTNN